MKKTTIEAVLVIAAAIAAAACAGQASPRPAGADQPAASAAQKPASGGAQQPAAPAVQNPAAGSDQQPPIVEEQPGTPPPPRSPFPPAPVPQPFPQSVPEPQIPPAAVVPPPVSPPLPRVPTAGVFMFDDFSYSSMTAFEANGWTARTQEGSPGVQGASWNPANVSFVDDPAAAGNRLLHLTAAIGPEVSQTQVCHQRKYLEGTYAARVRFTKNSMEVEQGTGPAQGEARQEEVVKSFTMITPYNPAVDPEHGQMDFAYLPLGGWGIPPDTLTTARGDVHGVEMDAADQLRGMIEGWHVLLIQAADGEVRFFVDGALVALHARPDYPDSPMSIDFSIWFIDNGRSRTQDLRTYVEDIDWVFHAKDVVMNGTDVMRQVNGLRDSGIAFKDTVPQETPPLDCPCDR